MDPIELANRLSAAIEENSRLAKKADKYGMWCDLFENTVLAKYTSAEAALHDIEFMEKENAAMARQIKRYEADRPERIARTKRVAARVKAIQTLIGGNRLQIPAGSEWENLEIRVDEKNHSVFVSGEIYHTTDYTGERVLIKTGAGTSDVANWACEIESLAGIPGLGEQLVAYSNKIDY